MSKYEQDQQNSSSGIPLQINQQPGNPPSPYAYWGDSHDGMGVFGTSATFFGVFGVSVDEAGVAARSTNFHAVDGLGLGNQSFGVLGEGGNAGVAAFHLGNRNAAYLASDCCAAYFVGEVSVHGKLSKSSGGFLIDHPLDPANKHLSHSFVESSDMKNIYDGVVVLDPNGEAVVEFPEWFDSLNTDFRYQLTPIGAPGPNLYIAEEISKRRFKIAGGSSSMKVCWQVTGIRQDAWAKAQPIQVEEDKPTEERGYYIHPELHGAPKEKSIERVRHPQPPQRTP